MQIMKQLSVVAMQLRACVLRRFTVAGIAPALRLPTLIQVFCGLVLASSATAQPESCVEIEADWFNNWRFIDFYDEEEGIDWRDQDDNQDGFSEKSVMNFWFSVRPGCESGNPIDDLYYPTKVYEKVYFRLNEQSENLTLTDDRSWLHLCTTPAHYILEPEAVSGFSVATLELPDLVYSMDFPEVSVGLTARNPFVKGRHVYDFKVEVYREGREEPDGVTTFGTCPMLYRYPIEYRAWESSQTDVYRNASVIHAQDGTPITDVRLRELFNANIGSNYESAIFLFTQSFGGNALNDFSNLPRSVVFSCAAPNREVHTFGVKRLLMQNLRPYLPDHYDYWYTFQELMEAVLSNNSWDSQKSVASRNHYFDSPMIVMSDELLNYPNELIDNDVYFSFGGTGGVCLLYLASSPVRVHFENLSTIRANFADSGINAEVVALAGDGNGSGVDGALSLENLVGAFQRLGGMMSPTKQFILLIDGHGGVAPPVSPGRSTLAPSATSAHNFALEKQYVLAMAGESANKPFVHVRTAQEVNVGDLGVSISGSPFARASRRNANNELIFLLDKAGLQEGNNSFSLKNTSGASVSVESITFSIGLISEASSQKDIVSCLLGQRTFTGPQLATIDLSADNTLDAADLTNASRNEIKRPPTDDAKNARQYRGPAMKQLPARTRRWGRTTPPKGFGGWRESGHSTSSPPKFAPILAP